MRTYFRRMSRLLFTVTAALFFATNSPSAATAAVTGKSKRKLQFKLSEEQQAKRRKLALHCIAIEKDGIAIDPWIFLHGTDGKRSNRFSYFKPRTSLSFHGPGIKNYPYHEGKDSLFPEPKNWEDIETGPYLPFRGCVREIIAGSANRSKYPNGLMVFVHGGNNSLDGAIERAERLIDSIIADGYYPLFICWNSNMVSNWGEHLVHVRNGVDLRGRSAFQRIAYGWLTSPIYLASDLATAVARAPRVALDNLGSTVQGDNFAYRLSPDVVDATHRYLAHRERNIQNLGKFDKMLDRDNAYADAAGPFQPHENDLKRRVRKGENDDKDREKFAKRWQDNWLTELKKLRSEKDGKPHDWGKVPMTVSAGKFEAPASDRVTRVFGYGLGFGAKIAVLGSFSGGGENMWAMMNRRIDCMFYHTRSFTGQGVSDVTDADIATSSATGIGAASVFFRALEKAQRANKGPAKAMLVGHSMGAIVLNQALALFPGIRSDTIIYMAPACSVSDFNLLATPYLQNNPGTQFYNLTLNPRAEKRERSLGDNLLGELVPRGSLLVWIDDFLQHPRSFADRTFGQFENALLASRMFHPRVQGQIHICAFEAVTDKEKKIPFVDQAKQTFFTQFSGPTHHGDFGDYRFWRQEFYAKPGWESRAKLNLR